MLKFFQISFGEGNIWTFKSIHVQLNLFQKLKVCKYIKYKRLDFQLYFDDENNNIINIREWDDDTCKIDASISSSAMESITVSLTNKCIDILKKLYNEKNWPIIDIENIMNTIQAEKYIVFLNYFKKKWNHKKTIQGETFVNYLADYSEFIFIGYSNKRKELCRISIMKVTPNPYLYEWFFTHNFWDNDIYIITDHLGEINIRINPMKHSFEIVFIPKVHTEEQLKNFLIALDYKTENKISLENLFFS